MAISGYMDEYFLVGLGKPTQKKLTQLQNHKMFAQTFMRLMDTAMRRYRLRGLPDTCSERVILQSLITHGNIVFFKDPQFGDNVLALPGCPSGKGFNINGDPVSAWVYSKNGRVNHDVDLFIKGADEAKKMAEGSIVTNSAQKPVGVMVWENETRFPFIETVLYFANSIALLSLITLTLI